MSKILLVDDDQAIREVVQTILETMGHEVVSAANGKEAVTRLQEQPVELMLTDIFMPEMEGLETIREMRRRQPELKIIAMSGGVPRGPTLDYLPLAQRLGASAVLKKPFTAAELAQALQAAGCGPA